MPIRRRVVRVPAAMLRAADAGYALRRKYKARRKQVRRSLYNPQPTFTETFALPRDNFTLQAGSGIGKVFKVSFNNIPQWPQYMNLYKQYKINWVKVMVIPSFDTTSADINSNFSAVTGFAGMARIVHSIQNSPDEPVPLSEAQVLSDNGAKIRKFGSKWSCSFKPVPDVSMATVSGVIPTRLRSRQWFNFDATTLTNNPEHGAVTAYVTLPGAPGSNDVTVSYTVYYKVNFSLRDPQ